MAQMNLQRATQKFQQGLASAGTAYKDGVSSVTESPMEKAAAAQDKMLTNLTKAVTEGRWAAGLRKKSLPDWKDACNAGAAKFAVVAQRAAQNWNKAMAPLVPALNNMKSVSRAAGGGINGMVAAVQSLMAAAGTGGQ